MLKTERKLGFFDAVIMGLSGAIGFEVFVALGYPYFNLGLGSGIALGLLVAGLVNLLIMLTYCELSTAIPEVGGSYTYIKSAYGRFIPFVAGSFRWLASIFAAAFAAGAFHMQLLYLVQIALALDFFDMSSFAPVITMTVIIVTAIFSYKGSKGVGRTIVFAFLAIFAVIIGSTLYSRASDLPPIENLVTTKAVQMPGVLTTAVYTFTMFFGVRSLIAGAPKIKNPHKNLPKAILLSALLVVPLYISIVYTIVAPLNPALIRQSEPVQRARSLGLNETTDLPFLNLATQVNFIEWGNNTLGPMAGNLLGTISGVLISIAGMIASFSALGTSLSVQASILRGMSRDAYLPSSLSLVHKRFETPHIAIAIGSVFVLILSLLGNIPFLGFAASISSMTVFTLVSLSLIRLRRIKPYLERPFKTPLYPFVPLASIVMSIILILFSILQEAAIIALISFMGLAALIILTYYLRMLGRQRLLIALGGVGLSISIILASLIFVNKLSSSIFMYSLSIILTIVSLFAILRS
ncbi:MAG: APC family permease [Candidatus Bathyarchaeota archaeon]